MDDDVIGWAVEDWLAGARGERAGERQQGREHPGFSVAQICNLLYRRIAFGRRRFLSTRERCPPLADYKSATSPEGFRGTQITNLRYAKQIRS